MPKTEIRTVRVLLEPSEKIVQLTNEVAVLEKKLADATSEACKTQAKYIEELQRNMRLNDELRAANDTIRSYRDGTGYK